MLKSFVISIVACLGLSVGCRAQDGVRLLTPDEYEAAVKADRDAVIMDVRTPGEFAAGHIRGAVLLDYLDSAAFVQGYRLLDRSRTYYIYCRSGRRSRSAARMMLRDGYKVADMKGGIDAWIAAGKEITE